MPMEQEPGRIPTFATEAEEAAWWDKQSNVLTRKAMAAEARGALALRRLPRSPNTRADPATNITIRLADKIIARARVLAAKRGLRYQTYIKMLLHQALEAEEKQLSSKAS
jgi:hypothetical protein